MGAAFSASPAAPEPHDRAMDLPETAAAWAVASAALVVLVLLDRRPYAPGRRNYVPLMMASLTAWMVLTGHLAKLLFGR